MQFDHIDLKNINYINFQYYNDIITSDDYDTKKEFFDDAGKEHYRLLSYLSTLVNHKTIIDIGTHRGSSALALSYNMKNTVISFDIVDNVTNQHIRNQKNIILLHENIFNDLSLYQSLLLSSPIILIDIDPHDGELEYKLVQFLHQHEYQGLIICDDIWHFEKMRNHFWYLIDDQYKFDVTEFGHWSGTGFITFNPMLLNDLAKYKYDNSHWTLVTAYFNLTKCPDASDDIKKRDQSYYLQHAYSTLSLPHNLVVYCDAESYPLINQIRPTYLKSRTVYIIKQFDEFKIDDIQFELWRNKITESRFNKIKSNTRNTPSYYLFCLSRYIMLQEVMKNNYFHSTHFAWINICIQRMGINNVRLLPLALSVNRDQFSTCYINYLPKDVVNDNEDFWRVGACTMCSGFFTGRADYMQRFCTILLEKFIYFLKKLKSHADEQLYSPIYFENPDLFSFYYGDYTSMISNYVYVHDDANSIIYQFINSSFIFQNYALCKEACEFLIQSLKLKKLQLEQVEFEHLAMFHLYCLLLV
ncbi:MAG TPA: WlaTC/HtrL family glycosyltransferase [Candidatus Saccharimonadales bacterium]|nr:WlaTC/HtrL family glycosyltransferase [Candidatus Saccharimonadales bacterium]